MCGAYSFCKHKQAKQQQAPHHIVHHRHSRGEELHSPAGGVSSRRSSSNTNGGKGAAQEAGNSRKARWLLCCDLLADVGCVLCCAMQCNAQLAPLSTPPPLSSSPPCHQVQLWVLLRGREVGCVELVLHACVATLTGSSTQIWRAIWPRHGVLALETSTGTVRSRQLGMQARL